jgi:phosphoglycerate dehydrogenase-like enzyme
MPQTFGLITVDVCAHEPWTFYVFTGLNGSNEHHTLGVMGLGNIAQSALITQAGLDYSSFESR